MVVGLEIWIWDVATLELYLPVYHVFILLVVEPDPHHLAREIPPDAYLPTTRKARETRARGVSTWDEHVGRARGMREWDEHVG